eukprot:SAG31_NODE_20838_length_564_cov_1.107527_1_plen_56_part_01
MDRLSALRRSETAVSLDVHSHVDDEIRALELEIQHLERHHQHVLSSTKPVTQSVSE